MRVAQISKFFAATLVNALLTGAGPDPMHESIVQMLMAQSSALQTGVPANSPYPTATTKTDLENRELVPLASDEQAIHIYALVSPLSITLQNSFTDFGSPFHAAKTGPVTFEGLDSDGTTLFTAQGPYLFVHKSDPGGSSIVDVPLAASLVSRLTQLRIFYMGRSLTQKSLPPGPPKVVAIAVDATHVRVTFDGRHFGAITARPSAHL